MRRTEIIPQTTAAINAGHVFYHFSIMKSTVNPPSLMREHQICFFESHFTEIKGGLIDGASGVYDPLLRWDVNSATQWSTTWENGTWYNIAYEIVLKPPLSVKIYAKFRIGFHGKHSCFLVLHGLQPPGSYCTSRQRLHLLERRRLALGHAGTSGYGLC
jgi:hypothetical protein